MGHRPFSAKDYCISERPLKISEMNDDYSKFTDYRQREFLLDYIEKSESEFSEQTKIHEMKLPHELQAMAEQIKAEREAAIQKDLDYEINEIEKTIASQLSYGHRRTEIYYKRISESAIDILVYNGYTVHEYYTGCMPSDYGYYVYPDTSPKFISTYEEEAKAAWQKKNERSKSFWQKLFS